VIKNRNFLDVPNTLSRDVQLKDLIHTIDKDLFFNKNKTSYLNNYLCVCSGGTTSSCAKDNHITLDLRKNFNQINFDKKTNIVKIGGGVLMGNLLSQLSKFQRTFPIGLSTIPGVGYILTGGISPLSRRYGLAIDNIVSANGYFGNGETFSLEINNLTPKEIEIWSGIRGAAHFFSIITQLELQTFPSYPIQIFEGFLKDSELAELIIKSEDFPDNFSLQWIYSDKIYIYIVAEMKTEEDLKNINKYSSELKKYESLREISYEEFNQIKFFPKELNLYELNNNNYSEVISLLGENLGLESHKLIECLREINTNKPNKSCYVANQQLGGKTKKENFYPSLFVHRECTWKPWIFASWEKGNKKEREIALKWMNESWIKLKKFFPKVHLAQLHNHLDSHEEELNLAFGKKLDNLKLLKNFYDPSRLLPPL